MINLKEKEIVGILDVLGTKALSILTFHFNDEISMQEKGGNASKQ